MSFTHIGSTPANGSSSKIKSGRAAKARALLTGRSYFTHDDVQAIAYPVLSHRLIMKPESELSGVQVETVVADVVRSVPIRGARQ